MGSEEDDMCRADFLDEYQMIAEETDAQMKIFPKGKHPAILSNAEQAAEAIIRFLE